MTENIINDEKQQRQAYLDKLNPKVPAIITPQEKTEEQKAKENFDSDYEYTRKKLKNLVDISVTAIEDLKEIANETGEPRAYHVLGELIKNAGELTKGVMDSAKSKSDIDKSINGEPKDRLPVKEINNNTVFIGSTKQLLDKILEDEKNANVIDVNYTETNTTQENEQN